MNTLAKQAVITVDATPKSDYSVERSTWLGIATMVFFAVSLGFSISMPFWADASYLRLLSELACYFVMAQMWNLLAGYGGLVSIGQQAYIGIGGYALIVLANFAGINPFAAVLLCGVFAALFAVPVSQVVFRLPGAAFAIGTWAVAEIFRLLVANMTVLGGGSGASLTALKGIERATRESMTFWLAISASYASVLLVYLLLRSRYGLALTALRDAEVAAQSQGIDVKRTKFLVYLVSAFGFGISGGLYFLSNLRISPDAAFGVSWSPLIIFMVIIGGVGTIEGPLLGAVLFFILSKVFEDYGTWYLTALGLMAIVVTIWFPEGLWGFIAKRFDLHLFPVQRRLRLLRNTQIR
ncbi:branched-chain amino acid ABC transporter permease [Noviherbaspirillum sp.]|uniref:branched-chain amino acid ABC transporter permease n=1 Tax=Noviherbaspirillum sp. TaxID=1926288 RepID=UPI002B4733B6|nr:branched-chain amino acid ABC transporter permease [Noviherbaspirillum sp.]